MQAFTSCLTLPGFPQVRNFNHINNRVASCKPGERYAPDACNECECRNERNPERFDFVCSRRVCLDVNPDIGFLLRR
ncbi:Protein of unknown function [Gryllus bimaculatus]|nr:Protein of unknown function [Gryllus bimaculatus]